MSGSTKAWATIDAVEADDWHGTIGEIRGLSPRSGLHTIRLHDGERAGSFAVVEILYDENQRTGALIGRTPFRPGFDRLSD